MIAWRATFRTRCGCERTITINDQGQGRPPGRYELLLAPAKPLSWTALKEPRTEEELHEQMRPLNVETRVFELYRITDPFQRTVEYRERA